MPLSGSGAAAGAAAGTAIMPGWGTVIGGLVGATGILDPKKPTTLRPDIYDQYGRVNTPNTGAITSMQGIFDRINGSPFQGQVGGAQDDYVAALRAAASSPGLNSAYRYAQGGVRGDNLSDPMVDRYAQQAYQSQISQGADSAARTRAMMARGGVGFSTANQQAQNADMAAAASRGSLARSGILTSNRQFERGLQDNDVGMLAQLNGMPASYLSQIQNALYAPLNAQAGLTAQLSGGQQIQPPSYLQNPDFTDQLAKGVSLGNGLYSAYQSVNPRTASGVGKPMTYAEFLKQNPTSLAATGQN